MLKIAVILGSTRPGRNGKAVAEWVYDVAKQRDDAEYELVDIAEYALPHLDEIVPPSLGSTRSRIPGRGPTRSPHSTGSFS
jgi:NAD(P)H-dependent FMN reductase